MGFRFPEDVDGWLSREEGGLLFRLAEGKDVLEIGSYCGRSTICLAQSAKFVHCIDPFDGRGTERPRDTFGDFQGNLLRYGVYDKTFAWQFPTAEAGLFITRENRRFGLVFIDGDHSHESVNTDYSLALALLEPGGVIAFHDYREFPGQHDGRYDRDVTLFVNGLLHAGAEVVARAGSVIALRPAPEGKAAEPQPFRLLVGLPRYSDGCSLGAAAGFFHSDRGCEAVSSRGISLIVSSLTGSFNSLWAKARNEWEDGNIDGFAMIHSDVAPAVSWAGVLLREMDAYGADLISAVVPIKDDRGLTSTALDDSGDQWRFRRLTTAQAQQLPVTFGDEEAGGPVLCNTGLWLCRLGPWMLDCHFRWHDTIRREPHPSDPPAVKARGGRWVPRSIPEDYDFSRQVRALGLKVCATRAVPLLHWGHYAWNSEDVWGWPVDQEVKKAKSPSHAAVAAAAG